MRDTPAALYKNFKLIQTENDEQWYSNNRPYARQYC